MAKGLQRHWFTNVHQFHSALGPNKPVLGKILAHLACPMCCHLGFLTVTVTEIYLFLSLPFTSSCWPLWVQNTLPETCLQCKLLPAGSPHTNASLTSVWPPRNIYKRTLTPPTGGFACRTGLCQLWKEVPTQHLKTGSMGRVAIPSDRIGFCFSKRPIVTKIVSWPKEKVPTWKWQGMTGGRY